jgi:tetratricopeptide (TPR) repeat protein
MHQAWRKTITASVCALGLTASAMADPASMVMRRNTTPAPVTGPATESKSIWPWSSKTATAPGAPAAQPTATWSNPQPTSAFPSQEISPWKHPITYLQASFAEMPVWKSKAPTHPVVPPATTAKSDPLALNVPTGPPSPEFFIYAAQMCEKQGDVAQARQNLGRALSMWPSNPDLLRAAARTEDRQGNLPVAEGLYQRAVALNPQNAAALNDLGLCLAREGKLDASLQAIEQAVQLDPAKPLFRNNAATVLVEMRRDQQALAHLAAVHNPADANYNLGQLLIERGRAADAGPYFQAALQQNPGMGKAQEALAKLQGNPVAIAAPPAAVPAAQAPVTPGPMTAPQQQTWSNGPQLGYPATARTPAPGTSSYVPPTYLPPVANRPGALQR